ncbi:hypothetical protein GALL_539070 [mine drainage metagenome]|uniref:Uncharacterized protein n=1 Tax=mine drainage metagenome TaxID=410659 RepID=A0A1J5P9Q7_9ZZZZ
MADHLAARRHPPAQQKDEAAEGIDLVILQIVVQRKADHRLEFIKRRTRLRKKDAGLFLGPEAALVFVVFILDLADHRFDQILDGHQAINATVFVDHQCHMHPVTLHLLQQDTDGHRRRRVKDGPQHLAQVEFPGTGAKPVVQRKILEQDQPKRLVQRAFVDRQPRIAVFTENRDQFLFADLDRHRRDFGLWHRHVINTQAAQVAYAESGRADRTGLALWRHIVRFTLRIGGRRAKRIQKASQ